MTVTTGEEWMRIQSAAEVGIEECVHNLMGPGVDKPDVIRDLGQAREIIAGQRLDFVHSEMEPLISKLHPRWLSDPDISLQTTTHLSFQCLCNMR